MVNVKTKTTKQVTVELTTKELGFLQAHIEPCGIMVKDIKFALDTARKLADSGKTESHTLYLEVYDYQRLCNIVSTNATPVSYTHLTLPTILLV